MYQDKPPIEDFLMHYGKGHLDGGHSGRYPWGSGGQPYQHSGDFLARVRELRSQGLKEYYDAKTGVTYTGEAAIAAACGIFVDGKPNTNELRRAYTLAKNEERMALVNRAEYLKSQGYGYSEIGRKMGVNESTVRGYLDPIKKQNMMAAQRTADFLKEEIDKRIAEDPKAMLDIGEYAEGSLPDELRVSRNRFDDAIYILEGQGYKTLGGRVPQITDPTGQRQTTLNVIGGPDLKPKDLYDYEHIYYLNDYISKDGGDTFQKRFEYPASMDSSRLMIRYAEDGGKDKDGVIELRRNVPDLSLGESNYAQVRILVDNNRYLKGMALYSDDMPDGVDVIFNTNKNKDVPKMEVLKKIGNDPDNPFGSLIKDAEQGGQYHYIDKDGKKKLGLINKRSDEGDWQDWQDTLSSQFLSKQPTELAKRQLDIAVEDKKQEFNEIMNLNNNTVKKYYLESFANDCDSAAVHLKAAALPRQKFQVILPVNSLKDDEVYAPNYNNGEKVALIRYPHGGTFEIPICIVNNKNREGIDIIGKNSKDAIGINSKVAERLSGADFDGDTVMVIPTNDKIRIKSTKPLIENFEPKVRYATTEKNGKYYNSDGKEVKIMSNTQTEMGVISNLITDMTIKGADREELARAVRHSMVVIDAEKHKLDYHSSEQREGIKALKEKYQAHVDDDGVVRYGASTLISKAKSEQDVTKRQGQPKINIKGTPQYDPNKPEGALIFKESERAHYTQTVEKKNRKGEVIDVVTVEKTRMQPSTKMAETDDARTLISDRNSPIERVYADYANSMKALANEARKALYFTKGVEFNPDAKKTYQKEVESLNTKLDISKKNKPRERQAQTIANSKYKAKIDANPGYSKKEKKKMRQQELTRARDMVGAKRTPIDISPREWEAIQAGALRASKLAEILEYADMDKVKEMATPRQYKEVTDSSKSRIKSMAAAGRTNAEIASALGLSTSTVSKYLNG